MSEAVNRCLVPGCGQLYSNCTCGRREGDKSLENWDRARLGEGVTAGRLTAEEWEAMGVRREFGPWDGRPYGETRVTDPITGGQKGQKNQRMELLPWDVLAEVSTHFAAGASKYEDRNFEKGYAWGLSAAALLRHFAAWWQGEELDDEGLQHLNAIVFHALTLRMFSLRGIGTDDRPMQSSGPKNEVTPSFGDDRP